MSGCGRHCPGPWAGSREEWWRPEDKLPPTRTRLMFVRNGERTPYFGTYGVERTRKFLGRHYVPYVSFDRPISEAMYATTFSPVFENEIPSTDLGEVDGQEQYPLKDVRLWCIAPEIPL